MDFTSETCGCYNVLYFYLRFIFNRNTAFSQFLDHIFYCLYCLFFRFCTGAKSEEQAIKAVKNVVQKLRKGSIPIENEPQIEIQNIVASASLGGKIHLELAARVLPRSMYEPEQFPGLIHRMLDPKTVILLFASGKLVCTGAKKESEVYRAVHNLHDLLEEKNLMIYEG